MLPSLGACSHPSHKGSDAGQVRFRHVSVVGYLDSSHLVKRVDGIRAREVMT